GVEGTLGEDGAEVVGQAQRHEECVGRGAGAEYGGEHDVAEKAADPRHQRVAADREDALDHQSVVPEWGQTAADLPAWPVTNGSDSHPVRSGLRRFLDRK